MDARCLSTSLLLSLLLSGCAARQAPHYEKLEESPWAHPKQIDQEATPTSASVTESRPTDPPLCDEKKTELLSLRERHKVVKAEQEAWKEANCKPVMHRRQIVTASGQQWVTAYDATWMICTGSNVPVQGYTSPAMKELLGQFNPVVSYLEQKCNFHGLSAADQGTSVSSPGTASK